MSTHYGAMGQLSEHDGEILKVFTPRHWKIICSTPAKGPQCTIKQQALPGSMYFYKVNQSNLRLSALSLTLSELNPIYIHATVFFCPQHSHLLAKIQSSLRALHLASASGRGTGEKYTLGNDFRTAGCPVKHVALPRILTKPSFKKMDKTS